MTAAVVNNQPLGATEGLQQAIGKRCCRSLSTAMLQWCMENMLVLPPGNAFNQTSQAKASICPEKQGCVRHLLWDQGRGTVGREALQAADASAVVHRPCMAVHVWEAAASEAHLSLMLSNQEWNVGCF